MNVEALIVFAVALITTYLYGDDLKACIVGYEKYRDTRSLRAMIISLLLFSITILFVLAVVTYYWLPGLVDISRAWRQMTSGAFLVVGILTYVTRHPKIAGRLRSKLKL